MAARNALIVKLAAIGDVAMALPMVTALREAGEIRIAWLCGASVAALIGCVRGVDELLVIDDARLLRGGVADRAAVVRDAWRKLGGRRFDIVLLAHADRRYRHLLRFVRSPDVRTLGDTRGMIPGRAHADEYVRLVTRCDDFRARSYAPPPLDVVLPDALRALLPSGRPLVALAPGGARNVARDSPLRRWPVERYALLAQRLASAGYGVAITGGPGDDWIRSHFAALPVVDLVGRTDLPALVALYALCAAVVTHDSGPLHLAALAGAPRVALFGPSPPSSFIRPAADARILWPAGGTLACAPCYDGREFAACANNLCMQAIGVDAVVDRVVDVARR